MSGAGFFAIIRDALRQSRGLPSVPEAVLLKRPHTQLQHAHKNAEGRCFRSEPTASPAISATKRRKGERSMKVRKTFALLFALALILSLLPGRYNGGGHVRVLGSAQRGQHHHGDA
jgi:hypothetical protein